MPATGSPSPGGDNPERLEIMQYEGEVWDGPPRESVSMTSFDDHEVKLV